MYPDLDSSDPDSDSSDLDADLLDSDEDLSVLSLVLSVPVPNLRKKRIRIKPSKIRIQIRLLR